MFGVWEIIGELNNGIGGEIHCFFSVSLWLVLMRSHESKFVFFHSIKWKCKIIRVEPKMNAPNSSSAFVSLNSVHTQNDIILVILMTQWITWNKIQLKKINWKCRSARFYFFNGNFSLKRFSFAIKNMQFEIITIQTQLIVSYASFVRLANKRVAHFQ